VEDAAFEGAGVPIDTGLVVKLALKDLSKIEPPSLFERLKAKARNGVRSRVTKH
jgi:hypothetical protein